MSKSFCTLLNLNQLNCQRSDHSTELFIGQYGQFLLTKLFREHLLCVQCKVNWSGLNRTIKRSVFPTMQGNMYPKLIVFGSHGIVFAGFANHLTSNIVHCNVKQSYGEKKINFLIKCFY